MAKCGGGKKKKKGGRYNTSTNQWVLVNDTFDYGAFYYETFWDDGSAPLNDHKILSSDKKTYKCLMDSATAGRCFHPFSTQKKWADYGFTSNPSYIVSQMKARLIRDPIVITACSAN